MKTTEKAVYIVFPIFSLLAFSILSFIIFKNTPYLYVNLSADGFNGFKEIFALPLSLLAYSVPIWGIFVAILKYGQSERHFIKQVELQEKNNQINNYYKHIEEYIKIIENMKSDFLPGRRYSVFRVNMEKTIGLVKNDTNVLKILDIISENYIRMIYIQWFGRYFDSKFEIQKNVLNDIDNLYKTYLMPIKKIETNLSIESIKPLLKSLGFSELIPSVVHEQDEKILRTMLIFKICKITLKFSGQKIQDEERLYQSLSI